MTIDKSSFEKHFTENFLALCRYAHVFTKNSDQAKDVVQQVFLKLWEKRDVVEIKGSLKVYLYQMVRNGCLNYIRDHGKHHFVEVPNDLAVEDESPISLLEFSLDQLLSLLPERCRAIFIMKRINGMSYREIGRELSISEKTVENQMGIAFKKLREAIEIRRSAMGDL